MRAVLTLSADQGAVAAESRAAEDAGYDGVATGEHLFFHGPVANGMGERHRPKELEDQCQASGTPTPRRCGVR